VTPKAPFVSALFALAACGGSTPHMVKGETFTTGNGSFDEFFGAVIEVRGQARAAPGEAEAAHADLLKALGLESKAAAGEALDRAGARAKKLKDKGVLLHLEIAPEPKLIATRGKVDLGADEPLIKAVESSVKSSLETNKRLASVAARAAELEKRRADLRKQALEAFQNEPQTKRDAILAELDAAKGVLADAGDAAARAAGAASSFVVDLVQAVETGGAALDPAKGGKGRKGAGPFATKVGTPAAPAGAAPPPKKKPKGGDDFEP
jgi:hypothetical protein